MRYPREEVIHNSDITFSTPTEVAEKIPPVGKIHVPTSISWADE